MKPKRITRNAMLIAGLLALVLVLAGIAFARSVRCPVDGSGAFPTGETHIDVSGKLLYEYKCELYGHVFWVPAN